MSNSIRLSPKHGVNPSVTVCFWCGGDIGVALFGRMGRDDDEAPRRVVIDYDPCDKCKADFAQGFTLIETRSVSSTEDPLPIGKDDQGVEVYPTGRLVVITMEAAGRMLPPEMIGGMNTALVDVEMFERFQPQEEDAT